MGLTTSTTDGATAFSTRASRNVAEVPIGLQVGRDDAAVDLVDSTGDVGGPLGCEKGDEIPKLGRIAEAAQRNISRQWREPGLQRLILLRAASGVGADPGREEPAGKDQVDGDPVAR